MRVDPVSFDIISILILCYQERTRGKKYELSNKHCIRERSNPRSPRAIVQDAYSRRRCTHIDFGLSKQGGDETREFHSKRL